MPLALMKLQQMPIGPNLSSSMEILYNWVAGPCIPWPVIPSFHKSAKKSSRELMGHQKQQKKTHNSRKNTKPFQTYIQAKTFCLSQPKAISTKHHPNWPRTQKVYIHHPHQCNLMAHNMWPLKALDYMSTANISPPPRPSTGTKYSILCLTTTHPHEAAPRRS